jgi:hypothetical protein
MYGTASCGPRRSCEITCFTGTNALALLGDVWQRVVRAEKELRDYLLYWYTNVLALLEKERGARSGTLNLLALLVQTHVLY